MARIRCIKPEFPQSESMGRVSRDARLLFVLLWTQADDEGRLRGASRLLAGLLFPYDDDATRKIDVWLKELVAEGCIVCYSENGNAYLQICNWLAHQKIDRPSTSKFPPPREYSTSPREDSRAFVEASRKFPLDQGRDQGEEGIKDHSSCTETAGPSSVPPIVESAVLEFPCDGKPNAWRLTESQLAEWRPLYPKLDVLDECRKALAWVGASSDRRKTARGMQKFLVGWFGRSNDRAPSRPAATAAMSRRPQLAPGIHDDE